MASAPTIEAYPRWESSCLDLPDIVHGLAASGVKLNLITHGGYLDAARIDALGTGSITTWELPLLAGERALHDRLSGRRGAFDRVTAAIAELKLRGQQVVLVFVALRPNLAQLRRVVEIALALGADGLMLNRFNSGGEGGRHIARLQASAAELQALLEEAEELAGRWVLPMASAIPMPPCLLPTQRYERIGFGFCALGTRNAYYTVDPAGRLRPCNHSPTILEDLRHQSLRQILDGPALQAYVEARPQVCAGCAWERSCQGGCKAAAEACCGSPTEPDPFLTAHLSKES